MVDWTKVGPVIIEHPIGGRMLAVEVFNVGDGIGFITPFWNETYHPAHVINGDVVGDGPWRMGDTSIRALEEDDPEVEDYAAWEATKKLPEWDGLLTREAAWDVVKAIL